MPKIPKQTTQAEAIKILGTALMQADQLTREMAQVLLKNLCEHPDQAVRFGRMFEETIATQPAMQEENRRTATVLSFKRKQ